MDYESKIKVVSLIWIWNVELSFNTWFGIIWKDSHVDTKSHWRKEATHIKDVWYSYIEWIIRYFEIDLYRKSLTATQNPPLVATWKSPTPLDRFHNKDWSKRRQSVDISHLNNHQKGERKDERFEATSESNHQNIVGQGYQPSTDQPDDRGWSQDHSKIRPVGWSAGKPRGFPPQNPPPHIRWPPG